MRRAWLVGTILLASACSKGEEHSDNVAIATNYVPPSVTSRLDFGSGVERRFHTLDRNADGKITREEFPTPDARIARLDQNRDGSVSSDEFSQQLLGRFDRWDANKDGSVTSAEREAARPAQ